MLEKAQQYTKTTWINGETKVNAQHMNNIENGVEQALYVGASNNEDIQKIQTQINNGDIGTTTLTVKTDINGNVVLNSNSIKLNAKDDNNGNVVLG